MRINKGDHQQTPIVQCLNPWYITISKLNFDEQRAVAQATTLTFGDIRQRLQLGHQHELLEWPANALQQGLSIDQICSRLALNL